jgi:enediyne biosynthesis protein E4
MSKARGRWLGGALLAAFGLALGCGARPAPDPPPAPPPAPEAGYFEDKTPESGVRFTYRNGEEAGHAAILESLGGGVALLDYDGDGLLDIFLTGGGYFDGPDKKQIKGHPCRLYKNLGGWKFRDVTAEVGLDRLAGGAPWFYTHGAAAADYDNDGWPDLLVTGWGRLALLHNEPDGHGGRRFRDMTRRAGLTDGRWSTSAAWGDLDGDGFPDLYVCHYVDWSWANNPPCKDYRDQTRADVCPPKKFRALPHRLYRNNRDGTFTDVSQGAGLRVSRHKGDYDRLTHLGPEARRHLRAADEAHDYGKGLGVLIFDADDDGRPDLYVANDTSGNFLYLNQGGARFREVALERGVAYDENATPTGSMGVDAADFNGVGSLSIFVTNYQNEAHSLYRNKGRGQFVYASRSAGITAIGLGYVGFGTAFLDFDLDGNEDLFISNGHVVKHPPLPAEVRQAPVLFRNLRRPGDKPYDVSFEDVSRRGGPFFRTRQLGRGLAVGDLDNDGRPDVVLNPMNGPAVLLRNALETGHHWLGAELVGRPYRDAVGARLALEAGGRTLLRTVKGGGSYLSSGDRRVLFGLGADGKVGRLTARWPSGKVQVWDNLPVDRYWRLVEGKAEPEVPVGRR